MTPRMQFGTAEIIVGREREQATLLAHLTCAADGHGSLVLVSGDAGIGKTTLVRQITRSASDRGALVLTGHCYDLTTTPPYDPWLEVVRGSPRIEALTSLSQIIAATSGDDVNPGRGDDLFAWGLELFGKLAARQPLVLVLEDIHWADRASLDFLRSLGRSIPDMPALLVATYRADEIQAGHPLYTLLPAIIRESLPERIDLQPLDADATACWIGNSYRLPVGDTRRLTAYLQQNAEGNPFFAGEILREMEATGVLRKSDGVWSLGELGEVSVPVLLRQVLETRLGRVPLQAREALAFAAVIGQEVAIDLWQRLASLSDTTLFDVLEQTSEAALITLSGDGRSLAFRHALIREALYEEILPPRRRTLHLRVAETLLEADDPDPDAVAHHLQQAGDSRAGEWLIKAGDRAYYRAYSLHTALARYEAALQALPDDAREERGWLLTQLSQTVRFADPLAGTRFADEAEQIAQHLGNRALQAVAIRNRGINRFYSGQNGMDDILRGFSLIGDCHQQNGKS